MGISILGKKSNLKFDEDFDLSGINKLKKNISQLNNNHIEWGWINRKNYPKSDDNGRGGESIAAIAFLNEHGFIVRSIGDRIIESPPRPYFKQSMGKSQSESIDISKKLFKDIAGDNQNIVAEMNKGSQILKNTLINSIMQQNQPKNTPKTEKLKGHDFQWDDTGVMLDNIEGKVLRGNIDKANTE